MAESIVKEVQNFAADLYAYLWSKHKFNTKSLEECFAEKRDQEKSQPVIQKSYFSEDIGKAVLCSQYLLRDLCYYFFSHTEKGIGKTYDELINCLSELIVKWTHNRSNQFVKFIDTCAIIAEVILFSAAKSKSPRNSFKAVELLTYFFEFVLKYDFFERIEWKVLQEVAREQYSCINSFLEPVISKVNGAYEYPSYNCQFIQLQMKSPVFFPVPKSKVCRHCLEQLDDTSGHCFDVLELSEQFSDSIIDSSPEFEGSKSNEINSAPKPTEADETDEEIEALSKKFSCLFVGTVHALKRSDVD